MKITASMHYEPSVESNELAVYAENEEMLYARIEAVRANLGKHMVRGNFDAEKATVAFYPIMCDAAKTYRRDYGTEFTVTERWSAAALFTRAWLMIYHAEKKSA